MLGAQLADATSSVPQLAVLPLCGAGSGSAALVAEARALAAAVSAALTRFWSPATAAAALVKPLSTSVCRAVSAVCSSKSVASWLARVFFVFSLSAASSF